jgi:RNase P subunit RPR2
MNTYFSLLKTNKHPEYAHKYIKEIQKLSQTFNIRLKKEEKLQYCKKCLTPWNTKTKQIRLNPTNSCIEHICINCSFVRRYKYK